MTYFVELNFIKPHIDAVELLFCSHRCRLRWQSVSCLALKGICTGFQLLSNVVIFLLQLSDRFSEFVHFDLKPFCLLCLVITISLEQIQFVLKLVILFVKITFFFFKTFLFFLKLFHLSFQVIHVDLHLMLQPNMPPNVCF